MKEITVKEFAELVEGRFYSVESEDIYGIHIHMSKATISYDDDLNELTFKSGFVELCFEVSDCIECITKNEDETYTIEFTQYMSDILISTTKTIRKVI